MREGATARCGACNAEHEGRFVERAGRVLLEADCPQRQAPVPVSTDPRLFESIRRKYARWACEVAVSFPLKPQTALLEVTNTCPWECPICYASSGPRGDPWFLTVEEVERRARELRRRGGVRLTLTGGEPTAHPQLEAMLSVVKRAGLSPLVVTNGQALASDPALAVRLRRAGARKVLLQLDTLDRRTYRAMRGRDDPGEKQRAIRALRAAGMRFGFVTTVCRWNLDELDALLEFALSLAPDLNTLWLQCVAAVGRFPGDAELVVDREELINRLAASPVLADCGPQDFHPMPPFRPWGLAVHPDCEVTLLVSRRAGSRRFSPLARSVDVENLARDLASSRRSPGLVGSAIHPFLALMRRCRSGERAYVLRALLTLVTRRGGVPTVAILAGSFVDGRLHDAARIERCASFVLTGKGPVSACVAFGRSQSQP